MREYQCTKNNPYLLPHHLYMRMLYIIRDYERIKQNTEMASEEGQKDNVFKGAVREAEAIEKALTYVPAFYRDGVLENIMDGSRYPMGADERTFRRYKQRYIYYVAKLLNCI